MSDHATIRDGAILVDGAIIMHVDIAAPPERVFRALTDPTDLLQWWGPEAHCITHAWDFDLRPGGQWVSRGRDDTCGEWTVRGEILEYDPPRVFACTWNETLERARPAPLATTVVRYQLAATPAGTRLTLTHSGFGEQQDVQREYSNGWPAIFASLERFAQRNAMASTSSAAVG